MYDRYDGLVFDMDGTLLDSEPTHRKAWQIVLAHYGISFNEHMIIGMNGAPAWCVARAILADQQLDYDHYLLAREKSELVKKLLLESVQPLPLINVVKACHGRCPMAVGTGSEHAMAEALLQRLGLRDYFTAVVGVDDVIRHKPEPDTFLRCAELMGVAPERCVVFEDADFGLMAARAAGMDAVDVRQSLPEQVTAVLSLNGCR